MATKLAYTLKKKGTQFCTVNRNSGKEIACYKDRAGALTARSRPLYKKSGDPVGKDAKAELAEEVVIFEEAMECVEGDCERSFLSLDALSDHFAAVHGDDTARTFSAKERKKHAASQGAAMKDGSFPIKNATDLKNAIRLVGNAKNPAAAKAHVIKRAKALGLTKSLPADWASNIGKDFASTEIDWSSCLISCPGRNCQRMFIDVDALADHAEAVHTFDDIRQMVSEEVRDKYGRQGDYKAVPPIPSIYVWVSDLAQDWVVYTIDDGECTQYKASYSITDTQVTLGEPTEVVRRTVYDAKTAD